MTTDTTTDTTTDIAGTFTANPALPVIGTYNFRDLGGIPLTGGGTTAPGRVFRSDAFHEVDDAGRALLAELGVTRLVDLRHDQELLDMPSAVDLDLVEILHTPVFEAAAISAQAEVVEEQAEERAEELAEGTPAEETSFPALDLGGIYDVMLDECGANLTLAAQRVARAEGPVVFHCTAGKDRTGVLAALLLSAVGAERDAIVADYAATSANLAGEWARKMLADYDIPALEAQGVDIVGITTQSPGHLIEAVLDRLENEFGGAVAYLDSHGFTAEDLAALRGTLLGA